MACWNWKCALLSATARSIVSLTALLRTSARSEVSVVVVEVFYVALTAGIYAGLQQRALEFRSRILGNLVVALGVPMLAQVLDWMAHRAVGAPVPLRATVAVSVFAAVSALFHLHVMRRGAFLTGHKGLTLGDDFRRMPRLIAAFILAPFTLLMTAGPRSNSPVESEAAL